MLTIFPGSIASFNGTVTSINGYDNSVELSCTAGTTSPPSPCIPTPGIVTPNSAGVAFSVNAGGSSLGEYNFNVQGLGTDPNNTTQVAALTLNVVDFSMTTPSPGTVIEPRGATSPAVSFQIAAQGPFNQSVTLSCNVGQLVFGSTCGFTPSATFNLTSTVPVNATANVTMPAGTPVSPPNYTITIEANTAGAPTPLTSTFGVVPR